MLILRRRAHDPHTDARCALHDFLHSRFRARLIETCDVTWDESLLHPAIGWSGDGARPQFLVPLRGRARVVEHGVTRWLKAGEFTLAFSLGSLSSRFDPDSLVLAVDFSLGSLGTRSPPGLPGGVLGARAHSRLLELAEQLQAREEMDAMPHVARLLDILRNEGLPLDKHGVADLREPIESYEHAVARALTSSLSNLHDNPMSVDLEKMLGLSRRRVVDLLARVSARFDINGQDWRTLRNRWRLISSMALASHPRARTEDVAKAVGYGSARAFCHAFLEAGLPSPGNVRHVVATLA